ncbi:MAG TPA: [protein-PII] uridylyltransferase [Methylophilaceae bacterium]
MSSPLNHWRTLLKNGQSRLRDAFEKDKNPARLLHGHSHLVDDILREIWAQSGLPPEITLIAVGGYGRGELYPQSDVDILILTPEETAVAINSLETIVSLFWDIGLAIGHSVRTLQQCLDEASMDVTVQTNLLEARWLAGSRNACRQLQREVQRTLDPQHFFLQKEQEQIQRHARFNDTSHNLEPNIKESPGGLRDLHHVFWIARSLNIQPSWTGLVKAKLLSQVEAQQIRRHEKLLQNLRIRLHYLAQRREDRLLFDHQDTIARQMLTLSSKRRPSEQIMQRFYQSARLISLMNEILLAALKIRIFSPNASPATPLEHGFVAYNDLLALSAPDLFEKTPTAILRCFTVWQHHPELRGMHPDAIRALWQARKQVNQTFRNDPVHKRMFMELLRASTGVLHTLRRMHRYGILGRYIPAFGRITDQMQHDLFHVYTVDEHTLNVLRNVRRYANPDFVHEFPLCSRLFSQFEQPELLYIAVLFHDIAKGRGGDHSTLGAVDTRRFCLQHGLDKAQIELVTWLVRNHLIMSATAQQKDISDPQVISTFVGHMGDERHLTALYLLTVADIRGTSPNVWNAWKARLLENLFYAAQRQLQGNVQSIADAISDRQQETQKILGHYGISADTYRSLWKNLDDSYFLQHEAKEIAWQTRLLLTHINTKQPIVRARLSPNGDGLQVMIYTLDKTDLFARICGFFERLAYNIVEARINTTRHGYALDSFLILDSSDRSIRYGNLIQHIETELSIKLAGDMPPELPLEGRINRQLKHFPIAVQVTITPEEKTKRFLLSLVAGDRPGLLSRVAQVLLHHDIQLHTAKINTLGNRAEDALVISSRDQEALSPQVVKEVEGELLGLL